MVHTSCSDKPHLCYSLQGQAGRLTHSRCTHEPAGCLQHPRTYLNALLSPCDLLLDLLHLCIDGSNGSALGFPSIVCSSFSLLGRIKSVLFDPDLHKADITH